MPDPIRTSRQYAGQLADLYTQIGAMEDDGYAVDRNILSWIRLQLAEIAPGGLVGDFGCGHGRLLSMIRGEDRRILGVDSSRAMLGRIRSEDEPPRSLLFDDSSGQPASSGRCSFPPVPIITAPADPARVQLELLTRREVFVEAALEDLVPRLGGLGCLVDAAINSFNAICFSHPRLAVNAVRQGLRVGGNLYFTSNVVVPTEVLPPQWTALECDMFAPEFASRVPDADVFRLVLHSPTGPVPIEDHLHTLRMMAEAFAPDEWTVLEALLFPPEGCEHVHPSDERVLSAFGARANVRILPPGEGFTYVQLGVVATRKS